uniref:Uncharacterized protein n=1 Tax=Bursaphelenchus xylophilus TaxID=6326 RepID=A0A1I7RX05_BURXY
MDILQVSAESSPTIPRLCQFSQALFTTRDCHGSGAGSWLPGAKAGNFGELGAGAGAASLTLAPALGAKSRSWSQNFDRGNLWSPVSISFLLPPNCH